MGKTKLSDFLIVGAIIRTQLSGCTKWVTNLIQNISEDCIEIDIGLEKDYLDNLIMIGDTLKCKYDSGNMEYSLTGWITKINLQEPQSITLRIHEVDAFENARDSYRYDVYLSAAVKEIREEGKGTFAVLTNISRTGAAFIVKDELEQIVLGQDKVYLEVYISSGKEFRSEGLLLRKLKKSKGVEYGLKFINIQPDAGKVLEEFLNELANKDKEIYNKRSGFWSKNSQLKNN